MSAADDPARDPPVRRVASAEGQSALDGPLLRSLFRDAESLLQRHIDVLNAINVYPVPDGDTGTNMHLTLRAAVEELARSDAAGLSSAAQALAHGALMGARGNSGVILSQVLRGLAAGLAGHDEADAPALASAFAQASEAAYAALSNPAEGTILTVIRSAAEAVSKDTPPTIDGVLARAAEAAMASSDRTPELLPVLKEAGVVDAGGLGLAVILEGLRRSICGEPLDVDLAPQSAVEAGWRSEAATLHRSEHGESGYCTEYVVHGREIDAHTARERLAQLGTSLLVVGDEEIVRVHLHTTTPDDAVAYGRTLGELSQVKVDNLEAQIERWVAELPERPLAPGIDIVAVAAGEGIEDAFRSLGVTHLVRGGQTMNPSARDILNAIDSCDAEHVVVLPNNKNIIATAQQAAEETSKRVAVIPSRTVPQGIAAVLAVNSDLPFDANIASMERALGSVRSAEVTRAVRATTIEGRRVEVGQAIGIVDGELRVVADDVASAVERCVAAMLTPEASLLTVYAGLDARDEDAQALVERLRAEHDGLEVELIRGGQPHYPYMLSLE